MSIAQNMELKARLTGLAAARSIAQRVATDYLGVEHQIDTYFACRNGRLKLRQIVGVKSQLIHYARPDAEGPKRSDYRLVEIPDGDRMCQLLTDALDLQVQVKKRREIFLVENVRVHLDEVEQLGEFLEFEAVLSEQVSQQQGQQQLAHLTEEFGISDAQRLAGSYADLLLANNGRIRRTP